MPQRTLPATTTASSPWTAAEDDHLRLAILQVGFRDWQSVACFFNGFRSAREYKTRWAEMQRRPTNTFKRPWSADEDDQIRQLVAKHGESQWGFVASCLTWRSSKQRRERWRNHLDPAINRAPWTPDEDELVVHLQQQQGNQWTRIARLLPGRTDHAVRSRWHLKLQPQLKRDACTESMQRLQGEDGVDSTSPDRSRSGSDTSRDGEFPATDQATVDVAASALSCVLEDATMADEVIQSLHGDPETEGGGE